MKENKTFSIGESISFGWDVMKKNFGFWAVLLAITFALSGMGGSFMPFGAGGFPDSGVSPSPLASDMPITAEDAAVFAALAAVGIPLAIIQSLIGMVVAIILIKVALLFCEKKEIDLNQVWGSHKTFLPYVGVNILYGLIVTIGFFLLIIPGIIAAVRLQFAQYAVVDKGLPVMEALNESWKITKGNTWKLIGFGIVKGVINLLGFLVFFVGLLATIPTTAVAKAHVYRKLSGGDVTPS